MTPTYWVPLVALVDAETPAAAYDRMWELLAAKQQRPDSGVQISIGPRDHVAVYSRGDAQKGQ